MNEKKEFWKLLQGVYEFYGKREALTDFSAQVWWNACQDFDFERVSKAFSAHLVNAEAGQYLPKPADIIKALQGTQSDRSALAWAKAYEAAGSVGSYTDVVFDDPAIHCAIEDMGGWPKFCRTETKDLSYAMHRFCEQYKAYVGRGKFEYTKQLRGDRSSDAEHEKKGLPLPKPKLIGNPAMAMEVLKIGPKSGRLMITDAGSIGEQKLKVACGEDVRREWVAKPKRAASVKQEPTEVTTNEVSHA